MKIVQGDELPLERGLEHRGGTFHFRRLLEGETDRLDNFGLHLGQMGGDFYSPRHRHNFEQVRFQVEGTLDYGRDGKLSAGMVGYFPEGTYYGPQSQDPDDTPVTAVLQCGGASGSGYLSRNESKSTMDDLRKIGKFKDGVFRRDKGAKGKRNMDGYQAIWEHKNQRPLVFPKPRYSRPIFMDPANYEWLAVDGASDVWEKNLGTFSECRTGAAFLKLEPGANHQSTGRSIHFMVSGAGEVDGEPLRRFTTIYLDEGDRADFKAIETMEILRIDLPDLAGITAGEDDVASAAE